MVPSEWNSVYIFKENGPDSNLCLTYTPTDKWLNLL